MTNSSFGIRFGMQLDRGWLWDVFGSMAEMVVAGRVERWKVGLQFDCDNYWSRFRLMALDVSHER